MIEVVFLGLLLILFLLYAGLHLFLLRGLSRSVAPDPSGPLQGISIIIAARNEEQTIGPMLESLERLDYPADQFEVIVINDRSNDGTSEVITRFLPRIRTLSCIDIQENNTDMPHKKHALQSGIAKARFGILAFTDADCIVPPQWLREIDKHFSDTTGMVAGYSPYLGGGLNTYIQYEEFKNTVIAAAAAEAGSPYMCTGRNLAYRKELFSEVGGFEAIKHSVSGDDDLFMQLVHRTTRWKIRYMTTPESAVRTLPPTSFRQFIHQRTRHISASRYYPRSVQFAYTSVHLMHLSLAAGLFIDPFLSIVFYCLKLNIDALLIVRGMKVFRIDVPIVSFIHNEFLLILYSFVIGPLGYLKDYRWKESRS